MSELYIGGKQILPDVDTGTGTVNTNAFTVDSSGGIFWHIVNGVCFVYVGRITPKASGTGLTLATGLPTCKMYSTYLAYSAITTLSGTVTINNNTGTLIYSTPNTSMFWCSFSYPVD